MLHHMDYEEFMVHRCERGSNSSPQREDSTHKRYEPPLAEHIRKGTPKSVPTPQVDEHHCNQKQRNDNLERP